MTGIPFMMQTPIDTKQKTNYTTAQKPSGTSTTSNRTPNKVGTNTNPTNLESAENFYKSGCSFKDQGNFEQAIKSFTSAITRYQAEGGQENQVIQAIHQLVPLYLHQKNLPYAEGILIQALELQNVDTEDSMDKISESAYHLFDKLAESNLTPTLAATYYQFNLLRLAEGKNRHAVTDVTNMCIICKKLDINEEKFISELEQLNTLGNQMLEIHNPRAKSNPGQQLIGRSRDRRSYGAIPQSDSRQEESNEENEGSIAYLCSCCGLFGSGSTKRQESRLSDSLTNGAAPNRTNNSI